MEITDLLEPMKLAEFDNFCDKVDIAAMDFQNEFLKETVKKLESKKFGGIPKAIRKNMFRQSLNESKKLSTEKRILALTIYYERYLMIDDEAI